ncbi:MAG: phosphotransferase [Nocardioides sp.]|uniref:phosphotransferase n=1 Tax=Nocardioides sp. TaxID=35761 RepID=UPI003EFCEB23
MWQPEPGWERLPGAGPSTWGVWRTHEGGEPVVVKRLVAPDPYDPAAALAIHDVNHWRRAAEVALSGVVATSPGVRGARLVRADEDEGGITLVHAWVAPHPPTGLWLADRLGAFAGTELGGHAWLARDQLRTRLGLVERRGGWTLLARTPIADVSHHLWERRASWLDACDGLPQVAQHGDPSIPNAPGRDGDVALAVDWAHLGTGPVGADLGYLSLSTREEFDPMLDAYVAALPAGCAERDQVLLGAAVTAVYTALTRVDWALRRVADGEGALAGKFRHPAVAPYIRAMQRQVRLLELLIG